MFSPKSIWGGAGAPPKKGQSTKGNGLGKSSNYRWTCPAIPETSCHAPKGISKKISDIIPWRIHGAGIYMLTLIGGFCWWDPWHTIYSSTVRIRHGYSWLLQRIWIVSSFVGIWTLKKWGNADDFQIGRFIQARFFKKKGDVGNNTWRFEEGICVSDQKPWATLLVACKGQARDSGSCFISFSILDVILWYWFLEYISVYIYIYVYIYVYIYICFVKIHMYIYVT